MPGPNNYVANGGSGVIAGSSSIGDYRNADGVLYADSSTRMTHISDGTSNTAAYSETILGAGGPNFTATTPQDVRVYHMEFGSTNAAMTLADCDANTTWSPARNYAWADGPSRGAMYNHYLAPNSTRPDCMRRVNPGIKAARSRHPGGVNLMLCDGSVRFVRDTVPANVWMSLSTRASGEVIPGDF
jgi:prepilin-type processing-associated H-X9-DG protein